MAGEVERLQELVDKYDNIVFFGGAGVSTESGIPDFRSQDGLYHQKYDYPPETILSHTFFMRRPEEYLKFYDSDGEFIEAIDASDVITEEMDDLYLAATNKDSHYVATRLAKLLYNQGIEIVGVFRGRDLGCMYELYKTYGREFVNRIGEYALVIKEI